MKALNALRGAVPAGALDGRLREVYGCAAAELPRERKRLSALLDDYAAAFGPDGEAGLCSGPGRTELGGNHTDHQHGHILAAAVDLDAVACAGISGDGAARIRSAGYPEMTVDLRALTPQESERGRSAALVRGVAAYLSAHGWPVGGFNACAVSDVPPGSGLSSSAAYEVLVGTIFNHLFCGDAVPPVELALAGQYAENVFFGKPCGLMDQLASAVGGAVSVDFLDPARPVVERVPWDAESHGYALCVIDSGGSHAGLTDEYAAIPGEMGAVARFFGKSVLRQVDEAAFWARLDAVRGACGDRAALRAVHFFAENALAPRQARALLAGDFEEYLRLVRLSGRSSALHLQNLSCTGRPREQAVPLAIAAAEHLLDGAGAVRVHGGGFAGTVQAYVPQERREEFRAGMAALLGRDCCRFLRVRPAGGAALT